DRGRGSRLKLPDDAGVASLRAPAHAPPVRSRSCSLGALASPRHLHAAGLRNYIPPARCQGRRQARAGPSNSVRADQNARRSAPVLRSSALPYLQRGAPAWRPVAIIGLVQAPPSFRDLTLTEFAAKLAGSDPVPG